MKNNLKACGHILMAGSALSWAMSAQAEVNDGVAAASSNDIIVTGDKQESRYVGTDSSAALGISASTLDTPFSIDSVTRDLLDDQQATSLWEGVRNISGVSSRGTNSNSNEDFVIRGFQLDPRRNFYRDGKRFYNQFDIDPQNVERIEVLKGPASILYGQLEPGGIINIITPKMSATQTGDLRVSAGSFNQYQANGSLSGPVTNDVYYRIYGSVTDADSYRNYVEHKRQYINPSIVWNVSNATSLRFNLEWQHDAKTADAGIVAILDRPAKVPYDTFYGEPSYKTEKMDNVSGSVALTQLWSSKLKQTSSVSYYNTKWYRNQVSVEATRGGIVGLPGGPGYPGNPNTLLPREVYDNQIGYRELSTQHDFEYDVGGGVLNQKLLFGVSAYRYKTNEKLGDRAGSDKIDIYNPVPYYGITISDTYIPFRNSDRKEDNFGTYLQDMIRVGERWVFLVGIRYDIVKYNELVTQGTTTRRLSRKDEGFSPRAGVVFKVRDTLSLYSSVTRSFSPRSGNRIINEPADPTAPITADNIEPVVPEKSTQYEIGAKWVSTDQRFSASVALYDLTRQNVVEANPRYSNYSVQIGEQRSRGVDIDVSAQLNKAWRFIGSYSHIDAKIRANSNALKYVGNRLDNVPANSGSAWVRYESPVGLDAGMGVFYTGKRQGDLDNDFQLPAYTRVDASMSYKLKHIRFDLALKNVLNERYYLNAWRRDRIMPGSPRAVVGSVSYRW